MNKNITALILIVVAAGLYFTVTRGMIADAQSVKTENDGIVTAIQNAEELKAKRQEITDEYNKISPTDRTNLDKMIPSTVDNIRLIIDLNTRALAHGFSLADIKTTVPNAPQTGLAQGIVPQLPPSGPSGLPSSIGSAQGFSVSQPTLGTVKVSFTATATYDQFQAFMQDLESNLRIMDVTRISVTSSDTNTYKFDVQLQTYWLKQ